MDGEISDDPPSEEGDDSSTKTYTERFYDVFPFYLSIGMTYDQFWNGDPELAKYYRKADELNRQRRNQELWMQGLYMRDAVMQVLAKEPEKCPYPDEPYPLNEKERKQQEINKQERAMEDGKAWMTAFMVLSNARLAEKKGGEVNG